MNRYCHLNDVELRNELARLKDELEDYENEKRFAEKKPGEHIPAAEVLKELKTTNHEIEKLQKLILLINQELKQREF